MNRKTYLGSLLILAIGVFLLYLFNSGPVDNRKLEYHPQNQVYFVPNYDSSKTVTDIVVAEIGKAKTQILVQAYEFTSKPIANALIEAKSRGVSVHFIVDKKTNDAPYTLTPELLSKHIA